MRWNAAFGMSRPLAQWTRRHGFAVHLAGCFLTIMLAVLFIGLFDRQGAFTSLIWVANGVLLAFLLLAPRWRWVAYLGAGFAGMFVASALLHEEWRMNLLYCLLDIAEVAIGALLVRRRSMELPRFSEGSYLLRFFGFAVLAGPVATGLIFALVLAFWRQAAPMITLLQWTIGDSLGIAIATPTCVAIFRANFRNTLTWKAFWLYLAPLAAVTTGAFAQTRAPLLFLIYPLLILVLLNLELGWAAMATLFVVAAGGSFTAHGMGPFALAQYSMQTAPTIMLQAFIAAAVFMLYTVSVIQESQKAAECRREEIATLHRLVTENSRDVIILADFNGHRQFVSPSSTEMGGWTPEELMKQGSLDLVHPEDLPAAAAAIQRLRNGRDDEARFELRTRMKDGVHHWVESCLRVIRDAKTGIPKGILNVVRDISERKQAEQLREFQLSLIRAIQEVSLDGFLVVNNEGNVVSLNKRFATVWNITIPLIAESSDNNFIETQDQPIMAQCVDRVCDPEGFLKRVQELYADHGANDHCEVALKDGRTLERYSTCLRSESGEYLGRVWFFRDISERMLNEQKLQEAYNAVESLAVTDALTGLANRRHFDQYLTTEWRRSTRVHSPLSMLMIDVDFFKLYNDTYGHPRGDNCLKQIAEAIQEVVSRPGDLIARFGGDEFIVVLPNTVNKGALQVAGEICESISNRSLPHSGNPFGIVTISVGCATLVPSLGQHAVNLVEKADQALYQAKRNGRNQACNADPLKEEPAAEKPPVQVSA